VSEQMQLETGDSSSRAWTMAEVEYLRKNGHLGSRVVSAALGRSRRSVVSAATRLRISLRPPGERRGHILGQPRSTSWRDQRTIDMTDETLTQIRHLVLSGEVSMEDLERRARELALGDNARPVCPSCGVRPQDRKSTGLCDPCHLRFLAQAHRESDAQKSAQRELWKARQESSRAKRKQTSGSSDDTIMIEMD
jgi:ribosomal protein L37AE/L43A